MQNEVLEPWLRQMLVGDQEAFEIVYNQTKQHTYQTVAFLLNNKHDIQDVVSEIYIELFKSLPKYDFQKPFPAWFNGLIIRQIHSWNRKLWRKIRLFQRKQMLEVEPEAEQIDQMYIDKETHSTLMQHVHSLSYKLREVIILRYYHDYSLEEISEILAIPVGTVKSRLHLALQQLRKKTGFLLKQKEERAYAN